MPKHTPDTAQTEHDDGASNPCGPFDAILYSDSGALTQFGAFVEILPPGSKSSIKHWHQTEDEMVYMLEGEATVHEGDETYTLTAGQAATFKAGDPLGHVIENTSDAPIKYLMIGTRSTGDTVTYPDDDRVLRYKRHAGDKELYERNFTTLDGKPAGSPYKG